MITLVCKYFEKNSISFFFRIVCVVSNDNMDFDNFHCCHYSPWLVEKFPNLVVKTFNLKKVKLQKYLNSKENLK